MDKLHHLLQTAFGEVETERVPQQPIEFTVEREQRLQQTARKIAALREARLACEAAASK